ncbi:TRAP transporter small permease subunit [Woodsholea maritima]|uniref:TRAP transporter small permease subunit n=1 Tax=Woodsholea maritima TaxID=240237 RepID=UPI0003649EE4|nr:TRAP transporter small permease subunit [Woodsholea maritima]
MRAGDGVFLAALIGVAGVFVADGAMGGGLYDAASAHLPGLARSFGAGFKMLGWASLPILALPLVMLILEGLKALPPIVINVAQGCANVITTINQVIGDGARWLALGLVLVTALIVIQRYVFGYSSTKLQESIMYMHALLFLLAAASTLIAGGHVRVDVFYAKLGARAKALTDLIGIYLALFPMGWIILSTSQSYVGGAWRILERSRESDGLPTIFLLKTAIVVFAVMIMAQGLAWAIHCVLTLMGREDVVPGADAAKTV